ncbi:unnamed protein product [Rotaria magnacalcarata]|uniref:Uncharacterized protein n=1 Tax=Rotaria magnacalcarata TaxID=392030 RepID=A0A819BSZ7_9BILA|nr:unnamed protein product [Rotaria magnacalcarata]
MAIGKIFRYTTLNSLALFVIGCCSGGGVSNQWTVIFEGDVKLSAIMSFVSTASSFIMIPLYFYTIGKLYMDELSIHIPFLGLVRSLALVVIAYSIGIALSSFFPKLRVFVTSIMKPMVPYATQTVIVPLIVGLLTAALFWVIFIIRNQIRKFRQRRQVKQKSKTSERIINNDDKPSLNIEENNKKEADVGENMQKL